MFISCFEVCFVCMISTQQEWSLDHFEKPCSAFGKVPTSYQAEKHTVKVTRTKYHPYWLRERKHTTSWWYWNDEGDSPDACICYLRGRFRRRKSEEILRRLFQDLWPCLPFPKVLRDWCPATGDGCQSYQRLFGSLPQLPSTVTNLSYALPTRD